MEFFVKLFEIVSQNADKIGMGAISIGLMFVILYIVRYLQSLNKNESNKDGQIVGLASKAIDVGDDIRAATNSIVESNKQHIETNAVTAQFFQKFNESLANIPNIFVEFETRVSEHLAQTIGATIGSQGAEILRSLKLKKGLIVVNVSTHKVIAVNDEALELLQIDRNAVPMAQLLDYWRNRSVYADGTPVSEVGGIVTRVLATKSEVRNFLISYKPDGNKPSIWFLLDADPVYRNGSDTPVQVIIAFKDAGSIVNVRQTAEIMKVAAE